MLNCVRTKLTTRVKNCVRTIIEIKLPEDVSFYLKVIIAKARMKANMIGSKVKKLNLREI